MLLLLLWSGGCTCIEYPLQCCTQASEMVQQLMVPLEEGVNEHKRMQLRELAELNGEPAAACSWPSLSFQP